MVNVTRRVRLGRAVPEGLTRLAGLIFLSLLMLGVALAEDGDPPGRVARLSYVQGSVALSPAGQEDWTGAELNRPITTNDRLWSDSPGSRAELDIGGAVVRVAANTGFSFVNLDDSVAQMQVTFGTVIVRLWELQNNQSYEIDTPNVALLLDQPGQYRVDVSDSGDTTIVRVSEGQAEASVSDGQSMPIYNQQMVTFGGNGSADAASIGAPDGFDSWSFQRDREYQQSPSRQYVAQDMAGTADLDENGQWQNTSDYGPVWVPTAVATGWAPYSFGHWSWVSPWGWTWIDDASWGFAPFHYGRWARWHNSWCWVPGPRGARPVYSPAMVAWVGGAAGGAGVGWFPLGPREVYVPGYRVSDRYVRTINITNTNIVDHTYITNVYRNRANNVRYVNSSVPGAVTTVPRQIFTSAQSVNAHRVNFSPERGGRVSVMATPPAIAPGRQSVMGRSGEYVARRPPAAMLNRPVVARNGSARPFGGNNSVAGGSPGAGNQGWNNLAGGNRLGNGQPGGNQPGGNRPGINPTGNQPGSIAGLNNRAGVNQPGSNQPAVPPRNPGAGNAVPGNPVPGNAGAVDNRSWADRAHALGQPSLPPGQAPGVTRPRENGDANPAQDRPQNGMAREYNDRNYHPAPTQPDRGGAERIGPGRTFRDERPSSPVEQRPQVDNRPQLENRPQNENRMQPQNRPQIENRPQNENRPPIENRSFEQRPGFQQRSFQERPSVQERQPAPAPQQATPHFTAPPPAPVPRTPLPPPPPAPVHNSAPPPPAPPQMRAPPQPSAHSDPRSQPRGNGRPEQRR